MTIETIKKRIDGKQKEITKLTKKAERIAKAQATNWEVNPYYYTPSDEKWTARDLEAATKALAEYQEMLRVETEKANSRNCQPIIDFLNNWKAVCTEWYSGIIKEYYKDQEEMSRLRANSYKAEDEHGHFSRDYEKAHEIYKKAYEVFYAKCRGYYKDVECCDWRGRRYTTKAKVRDGEYEVISRYMCKSYEESMELLSKDLKDEADAKYDDIINRTNELVGAITDASGLKCNAKGNLDGIIVGERGRVNVNTIGAGGYNIQCYHFRTLIHKI